MASEVERPAVSETALSLASLVPHLPRSVQEELRSLLAGALSVEAPAQRREANLGLLLDLLVGSPSVPTQAEYEAARQEESSRGKDWPRAETLGRVFLSWPRVVRAAQALLQDQRRGVFRAEHQPGSEQGHTRIECLRSIQKCARFGGGVWPDPWTYDAWVRIAREQARRTGSEDPRLPGLPWLRKIFGDFDTALAAARRDPSWKS